MLPGQRATKPAKELSAQNPPQDCLQTRVTSGLVFAKQVGSSSKQARLVTRQGARQSAKMARNAKCASFVAMVLGRAWQAAGEQARADRVCQS